MKKIVSLLLVLLLLFSCFPVGALEVSSVESSKAVQDIEVQEQNTSAEENVQTEESTQMQESNDNEASNEIGESNSRKQDIASTGATASTIYNVEVEPSLVPPETEVAISGVLSKDNLTHFPKISGVMIKAFLGKDETGTPLGQNLTDSKGKFTVYVNSPKNEGNYDICLYFDGGETSYAPCKYVTSLQVKEPENTIVSMTSDKETVNFGDKATFTVSYVDTDGNSAYSSSTKFTLFEIVDEQEKTIKSSQNKTSVSVGADGLTLGEHLIYVKATNTPGYEDAVSETPVKITVAKSPNAQITGISEDLGAFEYNGVIKVSGRLIDSSKTLSGLANETIKFYLDEVKDENKLDEVPTKDGGLVVTETGKFSSNDISIIDKQIPARDHNLLVCFENDYYAAVQAVAKFTVNEKVLVETDLVNISPEEIGSKSYGDTITITGQLVDNEGNGINDQTVNVRLTNAEGKVIGTDTTKTVSEVDGTFSIEVQVSKENFSKTGNQTLCVAFDENDTYYGNSKTLDFSIKKETKIDDVSSTVSKYYGETLEVSGFLRTGNTGINGKVVSVYRDSKGVKELGHDTTQTTSIIYPGYFSISIPVNEDDFPKDKSEYTLYVCYDGDTTEYSACSQEIALTVKSPSDTTVSMTSNKDTVNFGDKVTFTVSYVDTEGSSAYSSSTKFTLFEIVDEQEKTIKSSQNKTSVSVDADDLSLGEHQIYVRATNTSGYKDAVSETPVKVTVAKSPNAQITGIKEDLGTLEYNGVIKVSGRLIDSSKTLSGLANETIKFYLDEVKDENKLDQVPTKDGGLVVTETGKFSSNDISIIDKQIPAGDHNLLVCFENDYYAAVQAVAKFTVNEKVLIETDLVNVAPKEIGSKSYGDTITIIGQLVDKEGNGINDQTVNVRLTNAEGKVIGKDTTKTVSEVDGTFSIEVQVSKENFSKTGNQTLCVAFDKNDTYYGNSKTLDFSINKELIIGRLTSLVPTSFEQGNTALVTVNVIEDTATPVSGAQVEITCQKEGSDPIEIAKGETVLGTFLKTFGDDLEPGNYTLTIKASKEGYDPATKNISFVVKTTKFSTSFDGKLLEDGKLVANPNTACPNVHDAIELSATLKYRKGIDLIDWYPVEGQVVKFFVDGVGEVGTGTTNEEGIATYTYDPYQLTELGTYKVYATFEESENYKASSNQAIGQIELVPTSVSGKIDDVDSLRYKNPYLENVQVDLRFMGFVDRDSEITYSIADTEISSSATLGEDNTFNINLKGFNPGQYTLTVNVNDNVDGGKVPYTCDIPFEVKKARTKWSISQSQDSCEYNTAHVLFTATLTDEYDNPISDADIVMEYSKTDLFIITTKETIEGTTNRNGKVSKLVDILTCLDWNVGEYTGVVKYAGNEFYEATDTSQGGVKFEVTKSKAALDLVMATKTTYKTDGQIEALAVIKHNTQIIDNIPMIDGSVIYLFYVDGKLESSLININPLFTINASKYTVGEHTLKVVAQNIENILNYDLDPSEVETTFTVEKAATRFDNLITITPSKVQKGSTTPISMSTNLVYYTRNPLSILTETKPLEGEKVDFYVDGELVGSVKTDAEGKAELTGYDASALEAGTHTVSAKYAGNETMYKESMTSTYSILTVGDPKVTLTMEKTNFTYGESALKNVATLVTTTSFVKRDENARYTVKDSNGEIVTFGTKKLETIVGGTINFDGSILIPGEYTLLIEVDDISDEEIVTYSAIKEFTVSEADSTLSFALLDASLKDESTTYKTDGQISAVATHLTTSLPIVSVDDKDIIYTFYVDGEKVQEGSSKTFVIKAHDFTVGQHTIYVTATGSKGYKDKETSQKTFTVEKSTTRFENLITVAPSKVQKGSTTPISMSTNLVYYTRNPLSVLSETKPLAGEMVDFYVDGKLVDSVKTDENGKVEIKDFDASELTPGTHTVSAKYEGNETTYKEAITSTYSLITISNPKVTATLTKTSFTYGQAALQSVSTIVTTVDFVTRDSNARYIVKDAEGETVLSGTAILTSNLGGTFNVDLSSLSAGEYTLTVEVDDISDAEPVTYSNQKSFTINKADSTLSLSLVDANLDEETNVYLTTGQINAVVSHNTKITPVKEIDEEDMVYTFFVDGVNVQESNSKTCEINASDYAEGPHTIYVTSTDSKNYVDNATSEQTFTVHNPVVTGEVNDKDSIVESSEYLSNVEFTLSFTDFYSVSDEVSYVVEEQPSVTGESTIEDLETGVFAADLSDLEAGTYTLVVTVTDERKVESEDYTCEIPFTVLMVEPKVTQYVNNLKVEWEEVQGAESYTVWYKEADGEWEVFEEGITDNHLDTGKLNSNNDYSFKVEAFDENDELITSSVESEAITYYDTPEIIYFTRWTKGSTTITWTPVEGAQGYKLYYRRDDWSSDKDWIAFATTDADTTSYLDSGLKEERSYHYAVVATDDEGNDLTPFDKENAKWIHRYSNPQVTLTLSHNQGNIILSWDAIPQAVELDTPVYYAVYYRRTDWTDANKWKMLKVTDELSFEDTGCITGKTYQYAVQVYDEVGTFDAYNMVTLSSYDTRTMTYYKIPYDITVTPQSDKTKVNISWHGILDIENYNVYYKRDDFTGWKLLRSSVKGNSTTDSNLKPGHTYTYTVRCADANGNPISSYDLEGASYTCP